MDTERNIRILEFLTSLGFRRQLVVKALLVLNELKQEQIATDFKVNKPLVCQTINGVRKNPRAYAAVSRSLGVPVRELFGDYYSKGTQP